MTGAPVGFIKVKTDRARNHDGNAFGLGQLPGDRASAVPLQLPQMRPVGWLKKKRKKPMRNPSHSV